MKSTHKIIIAGIISCSTLGMTATAQTGVASFDQAAAAEVKTETVKMALTGLK